MKIAFLYVTTVLLSVAVHAASIVDPSFNPGTGAGGGIVEQALPQPDGKILVCGNFTSFNGQNRGYVARLNSDGSVDSSFLAQPGYWVRNMALQADGKIIIGGYFTTVQGVPRNLVARLNSDGSLDPSFNPGLGARDIIAGGVDGNIDPFVFWVAVQPDGKILITGNFRSYDGASSTGLARINPDGSRDTSFNVGPGFDSWGRHILVLPNGQIL
ncbi:MAG TPA: delta-60 repeat domain-containing protein, partial [Verrucomicrobiae bacterium]|nr:delta-60 repeat domain-containing protein [Verrucomicrobiae bacterium]